jgi:hypothetical protein
MRFRRRIFRFRNRPNLALSPFLADMIRSLANSTLQFRRRPTWRDAIPQSVWSGREVHSSATGAIAGYLT